MTPCYFVSRYERVYKDVDASVKKVEEIGSPKTWNLSITLRGVIF
jgi:hypothetical protein